MINTYNFLWLIAILLIIYILTGCNALGVNLEDKRTIVIQKSPYLVVANGDISLEDVYLIKDTLLFLKDEKFIDCNFSNIKININGDCNETK